MKPGAAQEPPQKELLILVAAAVEPEARPDVADALEARASLCCALERAGWAAEAWDITQSLLTSSERLFGCLKKTGATCVFNLFEGFGNDSGAEHRFRALLEKTGIPCTGNPAAVLETCLSKETVSSLLRENGIPVPEGKTLLPGSSLSLLDDLPLPLFLKPLREDGSVGVDEKSLVTDRMDLARRAMEKLTLFSGGIRVEEFLPGKEYSVSCIGNGPYFIPAVSVIDYGKWNAGLPFLDYGSKWDPASPLYDLVPEPAEGALKERAKRLAAEAGKTLGCRGYFRADLREKDGSLYVIDVNPNPDMGPGGGFLRQCREGGMEMEEVAARIVELALESVRGGEQQW
ncbi:ATP-grasp domain-containing protein [Aminivibrio sp.]|jgi:D-alanine-D-alanine ligase|uniref:ATP-grasp domain-containing protein n=1 Tax=Aminivibrio sp. TaxID=1872489 RepID=UPI001A393361|nr:ATP-grasp domain-containing protein [Aminivibrio sp.]MBL3540082.1 ATP-grasp domain-containing protein [Aminivibrio sp.]MDK2959513.1 D-alanine-D-alanine ligase [Synergistaceae bacterium]